MKHYVLLVIGAVFLMTAPAHAEEKKSAPAPAAKKEAPKKQEAKKQGDAPALQPDLRKILEEQTKKENAAWNKSNAEYASTCLKGVEKGKPVPPEKAVASTDCYIKEIDANVKPVALNTHMVDDMTKEWKLLARKYGAKQITHKEWMKGMQDTQKKFAAARIGIIKGLISDAQKQAKAVK